jgi:endonuclease/exonuclease/phosphatase family metal-dependent hydrolase
MGYEYIASIDPGYNRGIECSVLSRIPIVNASLTPQLRIDRVRRTGVGWTQVADKDQARVFQRSPLSVDLRSEDGYEFTLFIVHHKAGRSKENDFQREAEALKLVELLQAASAGAPGRNIIVLGDFNCAPWAKSFRTYLQAGMIDAMAHRTTYKDNPDTPLYRTHESDRVLDYILLNSAAHRELVIGSQHVYGVKSPPASFDWKKDKRSPEAPSDHYPLIIDLMTSDQP